MRKGANQEKAMASTSFVFQVRGSAKRPSISPNNGHREPYLSSIMKPFLKQLKKLPMKIDVSKTVKDASGRLLDAFVDSTFQFIDQPLLPSQSNFAPVEEMKHTFEIGRIEGKIPLDFPAGMYIRAGPNPLFGGLKSTVSVFGQSNEIWVEGEGMLHALCLTKDDQGTWTASYKNKYVETETFKLEKQRNKPSFLPHIEGHSPSILAAYLLNFLRFGFVNKHFANTSAFEHSGRLYASSEDHLPQEIDIRTLETLGNWDVGGSWNCAFTAHPKKAPGTGELIVMRVDAVKPYFVLGVISADGEQLLHKVDLKLNRCTVFHEIGVTENYNVLIDHPLTIGLGRLITGGQLMKYDNKEFARIGVMPRYGDADSIRWFQIEPSCTFHILNCFEDGDEVVVRGCGAIESIIPGPEIGVDRFEWFSRGLKPIVQSKDDPINNSNVEDGFLFARLYEWKLNMETGEVKENILTGTEFAVEFPFVHSDYVGIKNKYGYTQVVDSIASSECGLGKFGMLAKLYFEEPAHKSAGIKIEYHKFGDNNFCSGAVFVSKPGGSEEDDGWIISFVHNEDNNISQVHIIDVKKFESEPDAIITLPQRVPYGFHGTFVSFGN